MARPKKDNAEYFSHDSGMRNHRKIKAVRSRFGIQGYAMFCMFLECLTASDNLEIEYSDFEIEFIAGDFDVKHQELYQLLEYCISVKLFYINDNRIYSPGLKERLAPVFEKRERERKRRLTKLNNKKEADYFNVSDCDNLKYDVANCGRNNLSELKAPEYSYGSLSLNRLISVAETQQSKENKNKENKNKNKNKEKTEDCNFLKKEEIKERDSEFLFEEIKNIFCILNTEQINEVYEKSLSFTGSSRYNRDVCAEVLEKCRTAAALNNKIRKPWEYFCKIYMEDYSKYCRFSKKSENTEAIKQYGLVKDPSTRQYADDIAISIFKELSTHFRVMTSAGVAFYSDGNVNVRSEFIRLYNIRGSIR